MSPPPYPEERDRDLEQKYYIPFDENAELSAYVCIAGLPRVPAEKVEKLTKVLRSVFLKFGRLNEASLVFPKNAQGGTKGFAFIEFENEEEASRAIKLADNYQLDKAHVFRACKFTDIAVLENLSQEYVPPPKPKEKEFDFSWLTDPEGRDQFMVRVADDCALSWFSRAGEPETVMKKQNMTNRGFQWSPLGTYLACFRPQGVELWGGNLTPFMRFAHPGLTDLQFSPKENYIVTWSKEALRSNVIVWEVLTGKALRQFDAYGNVWPYFQWSSDDRYFSRMGENSISVYQSSDMTLVDKKSIAVENVRGMSWSPQQKIIAFWTPEGENIAARVTLMELPSKTIIRTKNLFNVADCQFSWQSEGDFLLVKVSRTKTKKKSAVTSFELFRLKEKGIPVDVLEVKDDIISPLIWEPKGLHFSAVQSEPGATSTYVSVYSVEKDIKHLKNIAEKKMINRMEWSPYGQFLVLGSFGPPNNGLLEFWNVKGMECMYSDPTDQFMCNDIEWDPSGRFLASISSAWAVPGESHGFRISDFTGRVIIEKEYKNFFLFHWRPRPPSLVPKDKIKEIKKNLAKYSAKFARADAVKDTKMTSAAREARKKLFDEWKEFMKANMEAYEASRAAREELLGVSESVDEKVTIEQTEDVFISETRTKM